jgi:chemotaxis protein methyltransferase CheR
MSEVTERFQRIMETRTGQVLSPGMTTRLLDAARSVAGVRSEHDLEALARRLEAGDLALQPVMQALINAATVGKTMLWRYPDQLQFLAQGLVPFLDQVLPPSQPLNIWSAACSTGEETFSIAMALAARGYLGGAGRRPLYLLGTDINTERVAAARSGIVSVLDDPNPPAEYARYITLENGRCRIDRSLVKNVTFSTVNLADGTRYPSAPGGWHVIICANVLIYFAPAQARQALSAFTRVMAPVSALMLGGAETLDVAGTPFGLVSKDAAYAYLLGSWPWQQLAPERHSAARAPPLSPTAASHDAGRRREKPPGAAVSLTLHSRAEPRHTPAAQAPWLDAAKALALHGKRQEALNCLARVRSEERTVDYHRLTAILLMREGRDGEAQHALQTAITLDPFAFDLHYYLGVACARCQNRAESLASLRRALFLSPRNPLIRYEFARQVEHLGDVDAARVEYEKVAILLQEGESPSLGSSSLTSIYESRLPSPREARLSVEARLAALKGNP